MLNLGTPEKPVRATCDVTTNYRYIYVKINPRQREEIEAQEDNEYGRLARDLLGARIWSTASADYGSRRGIAAWRAAT